VASGTANRLYVYLDATSTAAPVVLGLYANAAGDVPGALLAQGTVATPSAGAWNTVTIPPVEVTAGAKYWIAVLAPAGGASVRFRDLDGVGGKAQTSAQTTLNALPATWTAGKGYSDAPMSAYAAQAS
jgi:hypothetical protein